jgi:hypothetical protein
MFGLCMENRLFGFFLRKCWILLLYSMNLFGYGFVGLAEADALREVLCLSWLVPQMETFDILKNYALLTGLLMNRCCRLKGI